MKYRNQFFRYKVRFAEDDGDDEGGTGGNANPPPAVDAEQFNQLVGTVSNLAQNMQTIQSSISQLTEAGNTDDDEDAGDDDIGTDLETISRADFAKHIVSTLNKQFNKQLESLNEKIEKTSQNVEAVDTKTSLKEFSSQHPDFWDWKDELQGIVKETPGISIERAYRLARAENPDKARQLDEKHTPSDAGKKSKFGGLTPTSGQTSKTTKMSSSDAAEAAWQDSMADLEAVLSSNNV